MRVLILLLVGLPLVLKSAEYQWLKVTTKAAFAARDGAGAVTFRGKMWLLGGWNPGDKKHFPRICNNEVWSSRDGRAWSLVKPNTHFDSKFDQLSDWEGRHTAGYAVFKDKMWIVGGDANQGHYQNDVWNSADGKKSSPPTWATKPAPSRKLRRSNSANSRITRSPWRKP